MNASGLNRSQTKGGRGVSCEDQANSPTDVCIIWSCKVGFDDKGKPVRPKLEKRGKFWCCPVCGGSYGINPHPDLN